MFRKRHPKVQTHKQPILVEVGYAVARLRHRAQAGRSRVCFPRGCLRFFIDLVFPAALWPGVDSEISTRDLPWEFRQPVRRVDNLATFMCRLSENPGSLHLLETCKPV